MTKDLKIKLKYRHGKLPEDMSALLRSADDTDVRVLLTLALLAKKTTGEARIEDISATSGIDASDVKASLKFWRGAGVVGDPDVGAEPETEEPAEDTKKPETKKSAACRSR